MNVGMVKLEDDMVGLKDRMDGCNVLGVDPGVKKVLVAARGAVEPTPNEMAAVRQMRKDANLLRLTQGRYRKMILSDQWAHAESIEKKKDGIEEVSFLVYCF
jgi:hypothetical protein